MDVYSGGGCPSFEHVANRPIQPAGSHHEPSLAYILRSGRASDLGLDQNCLDQPCFSRRLSRRAPPVKVNSVGFKPLADARGSVGQNTEPRASAKRFKLPNNLLKNPPDPPE